MKLIYHHHDQDGYLSAAIMNQYLRAYYPEDSIELYVGSYSETAPMHLLEKANKIYVLDYSLPPQIMERFRDKIVWLDHHVSAIEQNGPDYEGKREIGKSGCLLTWEYCYPNQRIPPAVQLVNDRDVWRWEFGDETAAFHEATTGFYTDLAEWEALLWNDSLSSRATWKWTQKGCDMLAHSRTIINRLIDNLAWTQPFCGHNAVLMNCSSRISGEVHKMLRERYPDAEFAVLFTQKELITSVGLYRSDKSTVDVSKIAETFGGGGHVGASGFQLDTNLWYEELKKGLPDDHTD